MIMDNQGNNTHTFINNTTFSPENSLTHLLDTDEPEDEVANIKPVYTKSDKPREPKWFP